MAMSKPMTASALEALLKEGSLAGEWVLDAGRSTVSLKSKSMWGLAPVKGRFREVSGSGTVSPTGDVSGTVRVSTASVDTKNTKRDTHLRSADFFDSENHPDITFAIESIRPVDAGVAVTGSLTVRDRTQPLSFNAAVSAPSEGEVTFDADVPINRGDFGLTWNRMGMASMHNTLTIHAVLTRR